MLAQHLTDAGLAERALTYWRRAGELAAGRSANVEAIAHLSKGLELVGTLPDAPEFHDEELALWRALGAPLIATKGYAAPEVEQTYSRALVLCELSRSTGLFPILRGLWNYHFVRGELQRAHDLAVQLVARAEEEGIPIHRALARRALGTTLFFLGRFAEAYREVGAGIAIDDAVADWEDPAHVVLYTERAGVVCRLYLAWVLWLFGFPNRALETADNALALGQRLAHAHSLAFAMTWAGLLHNIRHEFDAARQRTEVALGIAREYGLAHWVNQATICRGFALVGLGQQAGGIEQLRSGLAGWNARGCHLFDTQWFGFLAEAHLMAGQPDDALSALDRATETAAVSGESHYQAELHRLRGVVLAETGEDGEAAAWLQRAIDTACSQQAKSLELRAASSLARLWRDKGRHAEARDLLAPIYDWFTEGFDTADLKAAKALLDELS